VCISWYIKEMDGNHFAPYLQPHMWLGSSLQLAGFIFYTVLTSCPVISNSLDLFWSK